MRSLILCVMLICPVMAVGQPAEHPQTAESEAQTRQFDFLLGEWRLRVTPKVSGLAAMIHGVPELVGTWRASRAFGGRGLEDELRISDASGNPNAWIRSLRIYSPGERVWQSASVDAQRARTTTGVARWRSGEMWQESVGFDREGKTYRNRTRFHAIATDSFSVRQDRSYDEGKSWEEGVLTMVATRVAPTAR